LSIISLYYSLRLDLGVRAPFLQNPPSLLPDQRMALAHRPTPVSSSLSTPPPLSLAVVDGARLSMLLPLRPAPALNLMRTSPPPSLASQTLSPSLDSRPPSSSRAKQGYPKNGGFDLSRCRCWRHSVAPVFVVADGDPIAVLLLLAAWRSSNQVVALDPART
jgi:hypothetical protein